MISRATHIVGYSFLVALLQAQVATASHAQQGGTAGRPRSPAPRAQQAGAGALSAEDRALLMRLIALEDSRPRTKAEQTPLVEALDHKSAAVRRAAVRGLGRLQQPALAGVIGSAFDDSDLAVRVEAANALGQAMQGYRGSREAGSERRAAIDEVVDMLVRAAERHQQPELLGAAARTLGRLPYADSVVPREVERVIVEMGERPSSRPGGGSLGRRDAAVARGQMHALYALARARRVTGAPSTRALSAMRSATLFGTEASASGGPTAEEGARVRRLAYLALMAAGDTSTTLTQRAMGDSDEQVRRLGVLAAVALRDTSARRVVVRDALRDPSFLVRLEGVRSYRGLPAPRACQPLVAAIADTNPHVSLAAIDALATGCDDREVAIESLRRLLERPNAQTAARSRGATSWHPSAHALLALARLSPAQAIPFLRRDARHALWTVRLYAARGATAARDSVTLTSLAFDPNGNVREAALAGISSTVGHVADRVFTAALTSTDYQVVLQAAEALKGAPFPDSVVPPLVDALVRITAERRETSRDPRMAILERLDELGAPRYAARLMPLATDFDSTVARRAATILERWTLRRVVAAPAPLTPPADDSGPLLGGEWRLMVKMSAASGGGSFVVRLLTDESPVTVARIVRLARAGYYAGLTFHRVEPGFVIQGGSPGATEYVGDGPFMRDELGLRSHTRGTLGISTRGRDTGDAQLFVNLIDNFRLDHDYTVFGEIVEGREVAEGVLEGDVIERIDVVRVG